MNEIKQFERKSRLPTKAELKEMKEKVKNPLTSEEDKKMTEKKEDAKPKKPRKRMTDEQGIRMMKEWDTKSVSEWAKEFGVSYQTVLNMSKVINKKNKSLCPPKTAKTRSDIADKWIALLEKEQGKK